MIYFNFESHIKAKSVLKRTLYEFLFYKEISRLELGTWKSFFFLSAFGPLKKADKGKIRHESWKEKTTIDTNADMGQWKALGLKIKVEFSNKINVFTINSDLYSKNYIL